MSATRLYGVMPLILVVLCNLQLPLARSDEAATDEQDWQTFTSVFRPVEPAYKDRAFATAQAKLYTEFLQDPENPEHLWPMADFYFQQREYAEAARWYFRVLEQNPIQLQAPHRLAESLYHAGGLKPALKILEALHSREQDTLISLDLQAEIYFQLGRLDEAQQVLEQIMLKTAGHPEVAILLQLRNQVEHNLLVIQRNR